MPRTNKERTTGPERDVAVRIALERTQRGWSAAEVSRRMTALGCSLHESAINKIEQGDPPRRITVDELVAFAKVFELEVEDFLLPSYAMRDKAIADSHRKIMKVSDLVELYATVVLDEVQRLHELLPVDRATAAWAYEACTDLRYFVSNLDAAIKELGSSVPEHLRATDDLPKPSVKDLDFRSSAHARRAALAASPPTMPLPKKRRKA